ncbi:MAG: rRNA maturation RNase YbeY [Bdellovibrionales bacterium]|nr:rRNA maturation RNase YbeY [Bdellovibrionales bacterium]
MKIEIIKKTLLKESVKKTILEGVIFFEKKLVSKKILKKAFFKQKLLIVFVSSSEMKKLNQYFFKKNSTTDILSFSAVEKNSLGELVLCVQKIRSQAKDHNLSFQEEMIYLILHGLLHLLGYHHEQGGKKAERMYRIQDSIFESWQKKFVN